MTLAWDTRLFTRASTTVYCTGKCLYLLIECLFSISTGTMLSFSRTNFLETSAMFLEFAKDLDNLVGGSLSMGDNSGESNNGIHFNLGLIQVFFLTLYVLIIY